MARARKARKSQRRMTFTGTRALYEALKSLPKQTARKALRPALMAGAELLQEECRQNILRLGSSRLVEFVQIEKPRVGQLSASTRIGVPVQSEGFVLRFAEWGTQAHEIGPVTRTDPSDQGKKALATPEGPRPRVAVSGQRPTPWFRPAFETRYEEANRVMGETLWANIRKAQAGRK